MHRRTLPAARICPACNGFAVAAVTTGARHRDGTRVTIRVCCPACQGDGHAPAWLADPTPARAGR